MTRDMTRGPENEKSSAPGQEPGEKLEETQVDRRHFLRKLAWAGGVTVVAASHDPDVIAAADAPLVLPPQA